MLELRSVGKRVGEETHLADISLRLEPGSLNVLLGPTLSGKTSLMRLMAGLDKPTSGTVHMDGKDVTGVPVRKRDVAMVYQQFINYPALSVFENIASPLRIAGKPKAEIRATVERVAALLKLTPYLDRQPLQLSGGQQQRTALARALAKNARLVLLDEPLANLDYKLREELRAELPKIFAESGAIFVYATAEPEEALLLGGHTATMKEGRVTQFGPTVDVYRRPNTLDTARTLSDPPLNYAWVRKSGRRLLPELADARQPDFDEIPLPEHYAGLGDGRYALAIRPHHLRLHREGPNDVELTGSVVSTEITGSETFLHVDLIDRWIILAPGIHDLEPKAMVSVYFSRQEIMLFGDDLKAADAAPLFEGA
ncbi:ABC transporter [Stappia sp. 22II-S9-Z10]|nr:ABC transporter [Stappia sp. 22II-S9-Z10]